jgi:hypothetical protein
MKPIRPLGACSVDEVLDTTRMSLKECANASQHFDSDANVLSILHILSLPLKCVEGRLEVLADDVDDDEIASRLESVTVGNPAQHFPLINSLNADLKTICTHLQHAVSGHRTFTKADADVYVSALDRYEVILKYIRKKGVEYGCYIPIII